MTLPMRNAWPRLLKPSLLAGLFFGILAVAQFICFTSQCTTVVIGDDSPATTTVSYGIGSPVFTTAVNGVTTSEVRWTVLAANLAVCSALAVLLAATFRKATRLHRPAMVCGLVVLAMIALGFGLSVCGSRLYWGYWMSRPPVLPAINNVTSVRAVIPVRTETDGEGVRRIVADPDYRMAERLAAARQDPYYLLEGRVLQALQERKLLPETTGADLGHLPPLFPLIRQSGLLAAPEAGYGQSDLLHGIVVEAVGRTGQRLVMVAVTGRELSNDHYPYYEMLFSGAADAPDLSYLGGQRFFYDVAGMEGMEWYSVWPMVSVVCIVIGLAGVVLHGLIRRCAGRRGREDRDPAAEVEFPVAP